MDIHKRLTEDRALLKYRKRKETTRIILHDSHTEPDIGSASEVHRWERAARKEGLKMGLIDVGYNAIIDRDGTVTWPRERDRIGNHTPGHNLDSIGICLVGGREVNNPGIGFDNFSGAQKVALLKVCCSLRQTYGPIPVLAHTEVQKYRNKALPDCPPIDMEELRQDLLLFEHNKEILDGEEIL